MKENTRVYGPRISVQLSPQMHEAAKAAAAETGQDMMSWVRALIERALAKREKMK